MQKTVSAREANHNFARILREVEHGSEFLVTRKGIPVARIVAAPRGEQQLTPEQEAALQRTRERLTRGWDLGGEKFDRDSLYDE